MLPLSARSYSQPSLVSFVSYERLLLKADLILMTASPPAYE